MALTSTHSAGSTSPLIASTQSMSRSPMSAVACSRWKMMHFSGLWLLRSIAASRNGLYGITRFGSIPQEAAMITFGLASSTRAASSAGAKPPKTTEWIAPRRAHAYIAMSASGIIGM